MLDLAGTAIGAVSLGLQVCQGLYKYCYAVKGRSKEVEDISRQIQALESTFRTLESVLQHDTLPQSSDQTAVASVIVCFNKCEEGVKDLQKFLESIGGAGGSIDVKGKIRDAGKALTFGFRQSEVAPLLQKLQALTVTAQFALQTLTVDLSLSHGKQIASLSVTMSSGLADVGTQISSASTSVATAVDTSHRATSMNLALFSESLHSRFDTIERLVTTGNDRMTSRVHTQALSCLTGSRLLGSPASLRDACDAVGYPSAAAIVNHVPGQPKMVASRCGCNLSMQARSVKATITRIGRAYLSDEDYEVSRHSKSCPLYSTSRQASRRVGVSFNFSIWPQLSMLVQTSLACTTGAGGFSISPHLNFRTTVEREKYRALTQIESVINDRKFSMSDTDVVKRIDALERNILKMFQSGEASPHHRFSDGSNLLHPVINCYGHLMFEKCNSFSDEVIYRLIGFAKMLVDAGVPPDEVNILGRPPLHHLIRPAAPVSPQHQRLQSAIAETLASFSANMPMEDVGPLPTFIRILVNSPMLADDLGLPPLMKAIVNRSEGQLRSVLAKNPNSMYEQTYGMTALHLSSAWPTGLSILLSAGADDFIDQPTMKYNLTAVDAAIVLGCEEAVALLFDSGCCWDSFTDWTYVQPISIRCIQTVARKLADRRKCLMSLAYDTLPGPQLGILRQGMGVLDSDAETAVRLLRQASVDVPQHLTVPCSYEGIYRSGDLDIAFYRVFFAHGFEDISHQFSRNPSPLPTARLDSLLYPRLALEPGLFEWLDTHVCLTALPYNSIPLGLNRSATGLHILAGRLVYEAMYVEDWLRSDVLALHERANAGFLGVFASGEADDCKCACSSTGCFPLTIALKVRPWRHFSLIPLLTLDYWEGFNGIWEVLPDSIGGEVLRFITFEALEMTHTCCIVPPVLEPDQFLHVSPLFTLEEFRGDIDEIHDEEEELHRRLEELLAEFSAHWEKSGVGLKEFIRGYWKTRMIEECVPIWDEDDITGCDSSVNFEKTFKTPPGLRRNFGLGFTFS